jgi:hypothetical protein
MKQDSSKGLLYYLRPEVAGGWAEGTSVLNREQVESGAELYLRVNHLHFQFEGWLGDQLIKAVSCYIAAEDLVSDVMKAECTGFTVQDATISSSPEFARLHSDLALPRFLRVLVSGTVNFSKSDETYGNWSGHDWSLGPRAELIVTAKALGAIGIRRIPNCEIQTLRPISRKRLKIEV